MIKTIAKIDGMMCGMCEKHINNAVSRAFVTENITSSHKKGETEIISETAPDETKLREVVEAEGYKVISVISEPYEKKKFGLFRK
ncbi:MAG: ATPase P [Ruminococcus sp.]|nr:ATPase P [Ruminococcus sp.]MDE6679538.1 ATPase P [Ruminococcus sp.]